MSASLLEMKKVTACYGGIPVLHGVSIDIQLGRDRGADRRQRRRQDDD